MSVPTCLASGEGGECVFLLHGLGADARSWQPQLEAVGREFRAVAWDMPGYRGSPPLPQMTFPALADALERLLDDRQVERAHLVGHSMGGMVAQEFLAARQERVRSATLFATSPSFGDRHGEWQRRFVRSRLQTLDDGGTMDQVARRMVEALFDDPAGPGPELARRCMAECPESVYRAAVLCITTFDRRANLSEICVPTLVLAAERDENAPPAMMERMASRIPGALYRCLRGVGHLAPLERPEQFNDALLCFLRTQRSQ